MLTFLEVGYGGNFLQGFRANARRAVPNFPQIALCALEMQSDPSPLKKKCFQNDMNYDWIMKLVKETDLEHLCAKKNLSRMTRTPVLQIIMKIS